MFAMRVSRRRFSSFSRMNSRLRCSSAVMAASLSASARRFCSSTCSAQQPLSHYSFSMPLFLVEHRWSLELHRALQAFTGIPVCSSTCRTKYPA